MSLLTPVYVAGQLKGIVLLDINKNNLRNIFYTHDRPLLWRFLNVTLTDTDSGRDIIINQSEDNLFQYVSYVHDLPGGIRVSGNDSNLLIVFYVQIMPDDFVMQLHRF